MSGKKEKKCFRCWFRGSASGIGICCDYASHTGKSRLKQVYEELGVDHLTPEVERLMSGENCKFYKRGDKQPLPMEQVVLPGTRPKRKPTQPNPGRPRGSQYDWGLAAEMTAQGKSTKEIAEALGCKESRVQTWRSRTGRAQPKQIDRARAIELFKAGATARRVAAELGIAEKTARKIKSEAGLTRLPTKWDKAREMFTAGASSYTIAEAIGVTRKTVMNWASKEGLKW